MVLVDSPSCCYYKLNIPHGIITIEKTFGKDTGIMDPGYYCCYCSHKMIGAMITKNSIRFCAPVLKYLFLKLIYRLISAQLRIMLWLQ